MSKRGVFKLCTTVALVLALSLTICAVFSVWSFTKHDANDTSVLKQLVPAYQYFDSNRDAQAIMNIRQHKMSITGSIAGETQPCSTSLTGSKLTDWQSKFVQTGTTIAATAWSQVTKLTSWRGSQAGCLVGGTVTAGSCSSTGVTGTNVAALAAVPLNRWRSTTVGTPSYMVFCTLSTVANSFVNVDVLQSCPASTAAVPVQQCGDHCYTMPANYKTGVCPYNIWQLNKTGTAPTTQVPLTGTWLSDEGDEWTSGAAGATKFSVWGQRLLTGTTSQVNIAESVGMDVSWYGPVCENPGNAWASPAQDYPLMLAAGSGCTLGADGSTSNADSQDEIAFLNDNADLFGTVKVLKLPQYVNTLSGTQTFTVYLNNRQRILTQNTGSCDAFRFNQNNQATLLLAEFNGIWTLVRYLAIVSASTAILSVMMVLLIILEGYGKQSQNFMTALYTVCLVGLFVSIVMIWKARYSINGSYAKAHAVFTAVSSCIIDKGWSAVLASWIAHTSFGNLGSQLVYTLGLFVAMLIIAVVFAIWALMQLAKHADRLH